MEYCTYDNQNRLETVKDNGSLKATYNYNVNGARSSLVYANGTSEVYTYNGANWLTSLTNLKGSTVLSSYNYTYYADGNQRTKIDHNSRTTTYVYDGTGRLKSENESTGFGATYQYDRFGNRTNMAVTGADNYTVAYSYDANNRLTQDVKTAGSTITTGKYFYDPNGNQLAKASETLAPAGSGTPQVGFDSNGVELYDYDGFNRMVRSNVNGEEASYTYRADGLRNSKATAAGTTTHLWDGANIAADLNGSTVVARYVRGIGLLMSDAAGTQKFYLYNGHGDVVQLAGSTGTILWQYDYDAFGNEREITGQNPALDANPFRYCAEYFDSNSGTYYFRGRQAYDPRTGRFSQEDPIRDGLNWYSYCNGNPIAYIDPWGLAFKWNEDDNHVFDLKFEVEDSGGTYTWNEKTKTATVSIYGVTMDFRFRSDATGTIRVTATTFYSTVVNAAGEMLFLTGHKAFGGMAFGNLHMTLFMFVGESSAFWGHDDFKDNVKWGIQFATVGGTQIEGTKFLGGQIDRVTDVDFSTKVYPMQHLYSGKGMVEQVYTAMDYYATNSGTKHKYNVVMRNSSSYMRGLLTALDICPILTKGYSVAGWKTKLPASDFGR